MMKIRPVFKLLALGATLVAVLAFGFALTATGDQAVTSVGAAQKVPASGTVEVSAPVIRTWEEMKRDEALMPQAGEPSQVIPFRPTIPQAKLDELKAQAAASPAASKEGAAPAAPEPLGAPVVGVNFSGVNQVVAGGWVPPDTHGAVGPAHFVQINNSHLDVWTKAGAYVAGTSLNAFFGYATQPCFDPRAVYDEGAGRWVITADAFPESALVQRFFVAVSVTNNPLGAYYIYNFNVRGVPVVGFWDLPMVGFNATNVIFTANFFAPAFVDARMFTVPKAQMYAGLALTPAPILWTGLPATLAPPIVRDGNSIAYLAAAQPVDNQVYILGLELATPFNPVLFAYTPIPVLAYTVPPNAPQPFTNRVLDTLDSRFVNMSSQTGNSIFQVHTINFVGFATPRWYEFDCFNGIVVQGGQFFKSGTSFDFNASIAAAANRTAFVTWNSTDPAGGGTANNRRVQVRAAGRLATDPAGAMLGNILIATSPFSYRYKVGVQRWGDYSCVSIDPAPPAGATRAFIVNERVITGPHQTPATSTRWGSRIASLINVP